MARLLLIRHAPTSETGRMLSGRLPGKSLSPQGREMAEALASELRSVRLAAIYSSPLERAVETATPIALAQRREVIVHEGLLEVDYGSWSGRSLKSLYRLRLWRVVIRTPSRAGFPGGESIAEAQHRMVSTCEELAALHKGKTVALVTHGDPIKAAVSHFLGQPLDLFNRIAIAPASVTVLDLPSGGWPRLVSLNAGGNPSTWQ
ncbi:MAG TPA: histidine phosphatase family protein [Acidimicrobiia bacterium]